MEYIDSWIPIEEGSDFTMHNFPFGIFSTSYLGKRVCTVLGDQIIDLGALNKNTVFDHIQPKINPSVFEKEYLNDFMALGRPTITAIRKKLQQLFSKDDMMLQMNASMKGQVLIPMSEVELHMPVKIGDYTDFYSSIEHATNVGTMFRDPNNALLPNWKHLPVGYHGRASSIILSGTPVHRPKGQVMLEGNDIPTFGPTQQLDFELELAFITSKGNALGSSISVNDAEDHIFGFMLFNDWSARDIQKWEYVPLGPFLGKSFASSVSPWVVSLDALEPFRVEGPIQNPEVLPYLSTIGPKNFDINLSVSIQPTDSEEQVISETNFKHMYWNMSQQLAHHTSNGCNINVGDVMASGTISGPTPGSYGSMLELAWKGTKPIVMPDGTERKFIHDHDTVIMKGHSFKNGIRVGFGEVRTKILPAI